MVSVGPHRQCILNWNSVVTLRVIGPCVTWRVIIEVPMVYRPCFLNKKSVGDLEYSGCVR